MYRTADHLVQKQFDRQKRAQNCITLDEVIEIPAQNADPDERLTFEEYSRQISAALSDTDAALFSMRYIEDLKIEDIAARMERAGSNHAAPSAAKKTKGDLKPAVLTPGKDALWRQCILTKSLQKK